MKVYKILVICAVVFIASCAPSRFVEPLNKKELAVGGSFGGPLLNFGGKPIPIPLSSIEVGYGLDSNLTVHGGLHTTALIFNNFQFDAGVTYKFLNQKKYIPNVSVNPGFNFVFDINDKVSKLWPTLDLNAYWNDQPQKQRWVFNPQIGHVMKSKKGNFQFTTEIKFLGLNQKNTYSFVPYNSFTGSNGATGIYLGLRYIFK